MSRLLAFAGSARRESFNKKLASEASRLAREAGAETTELDLRDYPLPLYDGDLEAAEGAPEHVATLRGLFVEHDGFLIACPEYNSSITPLLKNTIDWISRPAEGVPNLAAFRGKTATVLSASPGALGGMRGLVHVRSILGTLGIFVMPSQVALSKAHSAFGEDGRLIDAPTEERLRKAVAELVAATDRLAG